MAILKRDESNGLGWWWWWWCDSRPKPGGEIKWMPGGRGRNEVCEMSQYDKLSCSTNVHTNKLCICTFAVCVPPDTQYIINFLHRTRQTRRLIPNSVDSSCLNIGRQYRVPKAHTLIYGTKWPNRWRNSFIWPRQHRKRNSILNAVNPVDVR